MITTMSNTRSRHVMRGDANKETLSLRLTPSMRDKIDGLAAMLRQNRSSLIQFALEELLDLSPEEISRRILKRAKK